jgi:hypothetical protein
MNAGRFVRAVDGFLRIGFNLPTTEDEQPATPEPDMLRRCLPPESPA